MSKIGRFGEFGGQYIPETVMTAVHELEKAYDKYKDDPEFNKELQELYHNYAGRPSMLYYAEKMTKDLGGAKIYIKREDLNHTGSHKINNVLGQILLAKKMGKKRIIAETGAGQHGVATATVCALMGLECEVYMGETDMKRQSLNVYRMNLLGAKVFVANMVQHFAQGLQGFLPMVIFVVAAFLAFATGTSWGTFSILIPIVIGVFPSGQMMAISIASCLAGAVCGDHCSPISDTTIMASAGGHCEHVNHVATQLPYVGLVAAVCMIGYFIIGVLQAVGLTQFSLLALPVCIVLLVAVLFVIRAKTGGKEEI